LLVPRGVPHLDLLFPGTRFDFEADALRGLEGVTHQGLVGQRGTGLPERGSDGLDQPIFQNANTPNTAISKPAPVRQQGVDVTREGDML
jgi:hypothetical protein